ncbi:uncharacterized protein LOC143522413 [Brachyhypopomus gauderio]|uniref:uncharacterized protein LOC143522413 n=1 Tax=Brachyhypopomus gauderio TaxID=698409 RepID=UPI0040436DE8
MMDNNSSLQPKRRCEYPSPNNEDPKLDNPANSGPPAVLMLMTGAMSSYLRAGGLRGSQQLINTCVLDAILAAIHICYIKHPIVKSLLESNCEFRLIMCYLNCENYNDAKLLWLRKLTRLPNSNQIDIAGSVKDHLPRFAQLVCAQVDYRQETPNDHAIYETTLSKFRAFGNVTALGKDESNPALILVDCDVGDDRNLVSPLVPCVEDDLNRTFELDFLLLGRERHMVMCFSICGIWFLYDDDPAKPAFQRFNYEKDLQDYTIYLGGYVNKSEEYYHGVPETGAGTMPFSSGSKQEESCSSGTVEDLLLTFNHLQCASPPSRSGSPTDDVQMSSD